MLEILLVIHCLHLGFRARYCYYVVMDLDSNHVLSFYTAIKLQVGLRKLYS